MNTYRITAAQAPRWRAQYIGASEMMGDGLSKRTAHRIINECPSRILIHVEGSKPYMAIPRVLYRLILATRQRPGNPLMHDTDFQRRMAMRRWGKDRS